MLEYLGELLVGNYPGNKVMITKNQEGKDDQQERFLFEKNPQRLIRQNSRTESKI